MNDEIRDRYAEGRKAMIAAFAELTTLAMRAGVDEDAIHELHGRFFDGNVASKRAFRVIALLAELHTSPPSGDDPLRVNKRPDPTHLAGGPAVAARAADHFPQRADRRVR